MLAAELMAASDVLALMGDPKPAALPADALRLEPGLWAFVSGAAERGEWDHVASGAVRYLEHHVRAWAGARSDADAPGLVSGLFGKGQPLALGQNEGQRQGWESIVRGFLMGPRNAVQHGISNREDLEQYAVGVLGTCSLILVEVRRDYPDRFPVHVEG